MLTHIRSSMACSSLVLVGLLTGACADEDPEEPGDTMAADEGTTAAAEDTGEPPPSEDTGEPPAEDSGEPPADDSSGGDETTGGIDVDALYDCVESDFQVIQPLMGPGIDPETGALLPPMQETYLLHTTQILVKPEKLEEFLGLNFPIFEQLQQTEGLLGFALASEPNCGFSRTMGVWESEAAMLAFVTSGAHLQAMSQTTEVSITGRTTSWTVSADEMPLTWEMAMAEIADVEPSAVYE
jgi:quinol monooxygenase YgiN